MVPSLASYFVRSRGRAEALYPGPPALARRVAFRDALPPTGSLVLARGKALLFIRVVPEPAIFEFIAFLFVLRRPHRYRRGGSIGLS
jgi:hypothetical protein